MQDCVKHSTQQLRYLMKSVLLMWLLDQSNDLLFVFLKCIPKIIKIKSQLFSNVE